MSSGHAHGGPECRALLAQLSEYLDGELDAAACEGIDGHMDDCPRCQAFLESLKRTIAHVRRSPGVKIPEDLRREVVASYAKARRG